MVIIVFKPQSEGIVEFHQGQTLLQRREESFSYRTEKAFHLSARRAIIRFRMDKRDAGLGTASSQQIRRERRRIIAVQTFRNAVGQEGLLEDEGQGTDRLGGAEGMAHYHTGVVIEDGAEDGLGRAIRGTDLGAVHEIRDPEVIDVIHFIGLAHIGPLLEREPPMLFDHPE